MLGGPAFVQCWFEWRNHRVRPGEPEAQVRFGGLWRTNLDHHRQQPGNAANSQLIPCGYLLYATCKIPNQAIVSDVRIEVTSLMDSSALIVV